MLRGGGSALRAADALCLEAIRAGASGTAQIAINIRLTMQRTRAALARLHEKGLVARGSHGWTWQLTAAGRRLGAPPAVHGKSRTRRMMAPPREGSTAANILQLLDRPMRGAELVRRLGVTKQRILQLVVRHVAAGHVKVADATNVLLMIARQDDPTILLSREQERILSALPEPDAPAVTVQRVSAVVHLQLSRVVEMLQDLCAKQLVAQRRAGQERVYRLAPAGAAHCQRRSDVRRASPPAERRSFRSDRVRQVLHYLATNGAARTRDVGEELGIPNLSMNALMQYLKRRGLARKVGEAQYAPHQITEQGRKVLSQLQHRTPA